MDPPPSMAAARPRMANHTPLALTAITRSHSAASTSASRPLWPMPAVIVTRAGAPICPTVAATAAVDLVGVGDVAPDVGVPGPIPDHDVDPVGTVAVGHRCTDSRLAAHHHRRSDRGHVGVADRGVDAIGHHRVGVGAVEGGTGVTIEVSYRWRVWMPSRN